MEGRGVPDFNKKPGETDKSRSSQPRISTGRSGKHMEASQEYKSTDEIDLDFIEGFEVGDTIGGSYFITALLGKGGMGQVFAVEHIMLRQNYALKILTTDSPDNSSWRRFQTEARTIAKLSHPNIIKVHNSGVHNEKTPFYVMDFLDGENLKTWISREGPMNPSAVIDIFVPLCEGLSYAHSHGIIHRDIKPTNIMLVSQNGKIVPKLVDFGLVKLIGSGALSPSQQLTNTGEVFGSPLYMSPEQSVGRHINERSDVYSLGCSIFEALTGAPPFVGENVVQTILKHQNEEPPTLKQASMGLDFSPEWEAVMARVLQKEASDRYQSMEELAFDLNAIKAGRKLRKNYATDGGELFGDESEELEAAQKATSKRAWLIAVPLILLAVCGSLAGGYYYMKFTKKPEPAHVDTLSYGGAVSDKKVVVAPVESKELEDITVPFALNDGQPNGMKTFKFPDNISLGNLYVESPGKERDIVEAIGTKSIPAKALVTFDAGRECGSHPKIFRKFKKDDLQAVILPSSATDTDDNLHFLNHLTNIGILNLGGTDVTVAGLKSVAELPRLFSLSLVATNKLSGKDLATLQTLGQLRSLNFDKGREVTALLEALKGSNTLTDLSLNQCTITPKDIKLIATMPNLVRLSMNSCGLKSEDLAPLNTMPVLANLTIRGNDLSPDFIDEFKGNNRIAWLQMSPPNWSDEDVARLRQVWGPRLSLRAVENLDE